MEKSDFELERMLEPNTNEANKGLDDQSFFYASEQRPPTNAAGFIMRRMMRLE